MLSNEDRISIFEKELSLIYDNNIKEFAKLCLISAPDYFFTDCPASSSGKYHPITELGPDGTVLHTKKVFTVAYDLCRGLGCEELRDEILVACLLHDARKQGVVKTGHTVKNHPKLAADLVQEVQEATCILSEASYSTIRNCCGLHYGLWSIGEWLKPLNTYRPEELCVYLSDYIASKKCIEVDYKR